MNVFESGPATGPIEEVARTNLLRFSRPCSHIRTKGNGGGFSAGRSSEWPLQWPIPSVTGRRGTDYQVLHEELSYDELDLRFLVVRTLSAARAFEGGVRAQCSAPAGPGRDARRLPWTISQNTGRSSLAELLADLAGLYRSFGFAEGAKLPGRPDHVAFEIGFMAFLIGQKRLLSRLAKVRSPGPEQFTRCDLAQRSFFGDHLAGWVGEFAAGLRKNTGGGYSSPWAGSWPPGCPWNVFCLDSATGSMPD